MNGNKKGAKPLFCRRTADENYCFGQYFEGTVPLTLQVKPVEEQVPL
jgi:hypothetical protein